MKIYKSDGSYINNPTDTDFGWHLNDVVIDESVPFYQEHNQKLLQMEKKSIVVKLCDNTVETAPITSVIDFKLGDNFQDINREIPFKTQVCSLINPCTIESKVLLSVVHYALYKNFDRNMINLEHFKNGTRLPFCQDLESVIHDEIQTFSRDKNNVLSLMMDLILSENKCDRHELGAEKSEFQNIDVVDGFQYKHFCYEYKSGKKICNNLSFDDVINQTITKIRKNTADIDLEIDKIKKSFVDDIFCVNVLIHRAQKLEKDLRETKFLNDLIHLLNGELEKVALRESPFQIFLHSGQYDDLNLII
ncbi:uncharacterized protein LOC123013337 [Tribolium madens]|uniref:uncharacterized protein LOC123013337 n=1 Tax=Tribolium madens TaxID=41895 RepID=UPI001CF743A1|nr:uncharacterized protein LOC123013337 [Tribolium madens]XP_044267728.1 uncharacterized protein LOC123013337 [Tribolium madens]XP_044267729.1 uncharacterized protein LOC123013337 [Tribolium madens]XP_044267730.1 uncharacterized protein LOC123013337 [Tribolium madens]XP_044267731.1 uncharacterized protein LOC123013337 [Tribolium madens]